MPFQTKTQGGLVLLTGTPETCPICFHAIDPSELIQPHQANGFVERIFRCPRSACERVFIVRYKHTGRQTAEGPEFDIVELLPIIVKVTEHSDIVRTISPDFTTIFAEAERAEKYGLKLICGPGYRKALEFLIKDYVIQLHKAPDNASPGQKSDAEKTAETVRKAPLANVIKDHVSDSKVKQVAARAVWLGNDETHYERKWEDKDLKDLHVLIKLTIHWIEAEEMTKQVLASMPAGKT